MTTENGTAAAPRLGLHNTTTLNPVTAMRRFGARRVAPRQRPARVNLAGSHSKVDASEVLPRLHFLHQLRREMRRVDRSGALLSLVIYRMAQTSDAADTLNLRNVLLLNKRETDILGHLGDGVLAVICPDTGDDGVLRFIEKIDAQSGDLPYSVESATYPDHLFAELSASPSTAHGPSPLLLSHGRAIGKDEYLLKRPLDILGALVALVLFGPLMLVTALAVKLSSPGPVIFRQTRLGKGGMPFVFYKFRSMVVDGDDRIHREYVKNLIKGEHAAADAQEGAGEPQFKIKADPRVTWVGRIIRKTSIDELPQLFNVLKGELSLVGPRPPLPYEAENYRSWHLRRVLDVKPGITGLWQVEGRSRVSFDEMVRMDLRYVRGCSLTLDLRILLKTVSVVVTGVGAS